MIRSRTSLLSCAALAISALVVAGPVSTAAADPTLPGHASGTISVTEQFGLNGGQQDWTVPDGVTSVVFTVRGASGGAGETPINPNGSSYQVSNGGAGGAGGVVVGRTSVIAGQQFAFFVGGAGNAGEYRQGGSNGGGSGGVGGSGGARCGIINSSISNDCGGGGGGGATDIRYGGLDLTNRVIVAGGGGGGGGGKISPWTPPQGLPGHPDGAGQASATPGYGGAGANGPYVMTYPPSIGSGNGGGGGGFLGGEGGAGVGPNDNTNGGAGGTDYVDAAYTDASVTSGASTGNGSITVDYDVAGDLQLDLSAYELTADGTSTVTATVTLQRGTTPVPGQHVTITADTGITVTPVVDHGDGTYTATMKGRDLGAATITTSAPGLTATRSLQMVPGAGAHLLLTADRGILPIGDVDGASLTARLVDTQLHGVPGALVTLTNSADADEVTMVDQGDGTYTASIEAGISAEPTTYTASGNGWTGSVIVGTKAGTGNAAVLKAFGYTGAAQTWQVPAGVVEADVVTNGARGGGPWPGIGGRASARLSVSPGESLNVLVGGHGGDAGAPGNYQGGFGGFNGGGSGCRWYFYCSPNSSGGGGGGASDVRVGTGLDARLVVAGGGGGAGGYYGFGRDGGYGPFGDVLGQGQDNQYGEFAGGGGGYVGGLAATSRYDGGGGSNFVATSGPLAATSPSTEAGGNWPANTSDGSVTIAYDEPATIAVAAPTGRLRANGTSTINLTAALNRAADGSPLADAVVSATVGHGATASAVIDNGDGTYTTSITAGTGAADLTVTFTSGTLAASRVVHAGSAASTLTLSDPTVIGDGTSTVLATARFADGSDAGAPGEPVTIEATGGHTTVGPVTDNTDGTYQATITSSTTLGSDTITASNGDLEATGSVQVVPGPLASFEFSNTGPVQAGVPKTIGVTAHDAFGHIATGYAGSPSITEDLDGAATGCGTRASDGCAHTAVLSTFSNGVATLTVTAYRSTDAGHVSLTQGNVLGTIPTFSVLPAPADHLSVTGPASSLPVGQIGTITVGVSDRYGNPRGDFTGTVNLVCSDPEAVFNASPMISTAGSVDVPITLGTMGNQTVTASALGLGSGTATLAGRLAPTITSTNVATLRGGDPGQSFTIATTPGFGGELAVVALGDLPAGLSLTSNQAAGTLRISGTPDSVDAGRWPLTVTATNDAGTAVQHLVLTVTTRPRFTSRSTATAKVGQAFSFVVSAKGYPVPTLTRGGLPSWVKATRISERRIRLTGTPTNATRRQGPYAIKFTATSASGRVTQTLRINVQR